MQKEVADEITKLIVGTELDGTFIHKIFTILATGDFIEPDELLKDGEEKVGEMNTLEKVLFTLYVQEGKKAHVIMENLPPMRDLSDETYRAKAIEAAVANDSTQVAKKLFWGVIKSNHYDRKTMEDYPHIAVRPGFVVVNSKPSGFELAVREMFSDGLLGSVMVIGSRRG